MRSPTGQLFCLGPSEAARIRPPVMVRPDGTTSRLDQVCIDVAPAAYKTEVTFWTALTGCEFHRGAFPEFCLIKPPPALPIRILLQRLDSDRPTSAHLDLACSGIEAACSWHEQRGVRVLDRRPFWIVMEDPVGGTYCLTMRDPQTGTFQM